MDMNEIIMKVSDLTGVSVTDILSRKRTQEICEARQIFIYISYKKLGLTHATIGQFIDRSQQLVSNQVTIFNEQLSIYKGLKSKVDAIESKIFSDNESSKDV